MPDPSVRIDPSKGTRIVIEADGVNHVRDVPPGGTKDQVQAEFWKERNERQVQKDLVNKQIAQAKDPSTWRGKELHEMNRYELEEYAARLNPPMQYERRWPISTGIANINVHKEKWGVIDKVPVMTAPPMAASAMPKAQPQKRRGGRPRKVQPVQEQPPAA